MERTSFPLEREEKRGDYRGVIKRGCGGEKKGGKRGEKGNLKKFST